MLVLSRRIDEKILLPTVPATIKVIAAQAGLARIGIEAPRHVNILRAELQPTEPLAELRESPLIPASGRVNDLLLALTLLRAQLADSPPAVRKPLDNLEAELYALLGRLDAPEQVPPLPAARKQMVPAHA